MGVLDLVECFGLPSTISMWLAKWQQDRQRPLMARPEAETACSVDIVIDIPAGKIGDEAEMCTDLFDRKTPSPCFVGDLRLVKRGESTVKALLKSQRTLMQNYLTLGIRGVFLMGVGNGPVLVDTEVHGHPIQDPCGSLMLAMLVLRRNRPFGDCWMQSPYEMNLVPEARRTLAAILCVCQKLAAPQTSLRREQYVQYVLGLFLLPHELPKWIHDWQHEYLRFDQLEVTVVNSEPLLSILLGNPLNEAEYELGNLVDDGKIDSHQSCVLRGCCFFLLGSCMMNPEEDVLEQLAAHMSTAAIGRGVVSLLLTLFNLANSEPDMPILYRPPYGIAESQAADVMLYNAMSGHANQLRVGPYRADLHPSEPPHIVQRMLSSGMLARAKQALQESCGSLDCGDEHVAQPTQLGQAAEAP